MDYRHEWKFEISRGDMLSIRQRLRAVCGTDAHATNGRYRVRSLYFDTPTDTALWDNQNGVSRREKFRIRYYNGELGFIRLEKKSKYAGLGRKDCAALSAAEAQAITDGRLDWMMASGQALVQELYGKMRMQLLRPKTIVDYTREPFVYAPGHVRVTLDYDIRTCLGCSDFLNAACPMLPAPDAPVVLEVKWDEYLPSVIRDAVQLPGCRAEAFSKYVLCRAYG